MENWKCFRNKKKVNLAKQHVIKSPNGTGKTSIFEAILFALTGKAPVGFNLNTVRNDPNEPASVYLSFEYDSDDITILRSFGGRSSSVELERNGKLIAESAKAVEGVISKMLHPKIIAALWTTSLIQNEVLSLNFFIDTILEETFADAKIVLSSLKGDIFRANREINRFESDDVTMLDVDKLKHDIDVLQQELKGSNIVAERDVSLARAAEQANLELTALMDKFGDVKQKLAGVDILSFKRFYPRLKSLYGQLEREESKKATWIGNFEVNDILQLASIAEESGKCPICGGEHVSGVLKRLQNEAENSGRNERLIKQIKHDITLTH